MAELGDLDPKGKGRKSTSLNMKPPLRKRSKFVDSLVRLAFYYVICTLDVRWSEFLKCLTLSPILIEAVTDGKVYIHKVLAKTSISHNGHIFLAYGTWTSSQSLII